jgi:hypothetical protein
MLNKKITAKKAGSETGVILAIGAIAALVSGKLESVGVDIPAETVTVIISAVVAGVFRGISNYLKHK